MTRKFFRENLTTQNYIPVKETVFTALKFIFLKKKKKTIFKERQKRFDFLKLNCVDTSEWCIHSTSRACKIGEMRSWSWVLRIASVEAAKSHKMKIR